MAGMKPEPLAVRRPNARKVSQKWQPGELNEDKKSTHKVLVSIVMNHANVASVHAEAASDHKDETRNETHKR